MQKDDYEDPDSGHPTPRDDFNPDEATTSTPISFRLRPSGVRPNSFDSESFSPRSLFVSPRHTNSHSNGYTVVTEVIEMARKKKLLEEENDMMRNLSMRSEQELDDSKARIAELEDQVSELDDTKARIADLEEQARYLTVNAPIPDSHPEEIKEMEERWREDRRLMEKEKEEMEVKLKEELEIERKKVQQLQEWQLKCEMVETENGLISKRTASAIEKKDALLREKEEEVEELRTRMREMDRLSIVSDSSSIRDLEKELKDLRNAVNGQELTEARDEANEEIRALYDLRRRNGELEGQLEMSRKELDDATRKMEEEKRRISEEFESQKDQIMKRATSIVERNDALLKEKEEEMKEEMRRMEMEVEGMREDVKRKEMEMEDDKKEMAELRRKLKENEEIMEGMKEEKDELRKTINKNEKEMNELLEKTGEMERRLTAEGERFRDIQKRNEELEEKITVSDRALTETTCHHESLKSVREKDMAEILNLKTKVHELTATIDNLSRVNGELEEKKREGMKVMEQLMEKTEEGKKMKIEMDQLKAESERRREVQKKLEDELDIARKMTEDARNEVKRVREECEKEKEEERMEWMDKELRDSEEAERKADKERNESDKRINEALAEVNRYHQISEQLQQQYHEIMAQYATEMAEKEEELTAVRDRLAELENYPGCLVSIDGRDSEGRSVYDLLPEQLKDLLDQATDDSVRRAVEFCKSMMIRGEVVEPTPSHLPVLIHRLEEIDMRTSTFNDFRDFIVRIFKKLEQEEGSDELMTSVAARLDGELVHLEEGWMKKEKRNEKMDERLRRSEDERRRIEEEAIDADEGRKKALNELMELRSQFVHMKADKESFEKAAVGFREQFEVKVTELNDADDELDQLREEYQRMVNEKDRKIRMQDQTNIQVETRLEDEIVKNSELSKKWLALSSELHSVQNEKRQLVKDLEKSNSGKLKLIDLIREYMDGLKQHINVFKRVKARNEKRQELLDQTVLGIENTIREMKIAKVGGHQILKQLETTIRSEMLDYLSEDRKDYIESDRLKKHIKSLREENKYLTDDNKENIH